MERTQLSISRNITPNKITVNIWWLWNEILLAVWLPRC